MRIRSPKDFWAGLFFIAVALGFILLARHYGTGNMHRMGPGLFPILVSTLFAVALAHLGLMAAVAVLVLVGALASRESRPLETIGLVVVLIAFSSVVFV